MADKIDAELGNLIHKLSAIQEEVGGKAKTAETVTGPDGKADRFMELKAIMMGRLATIKSLMESIQAAERGTANPKEIVAQQNSMRENVRQLSEEWRELETIYKNEAKKRKSKFSPEEMDLRLNVVLQLQQEISAVKDMQRAKYVRNYQRGGFSSLEESDLLQGGSNAPAGVNVPRGVAVNQGRNMEMTDQHRMQLQQIKDRDAQFDVQIDEIGKGVDELKQIAMAQNEEVKRQNIMLDGLEQKIEVVHEKITNVNANLKEHLDALGGADKMCMNMMCLIVLLGIIAVIYKLMDSTG